MGNDHPSKILMFLCVNQNYFAELGLKIVSGRHKQDVIFCWAVNIANKFILHAMDKRIVKLVQL